MLWAKVGEEVWIFSDVAESSGGPIEDAFPDARAAARIIEA